jgi:hypothetical protein
MRIPEAVRANLWLLALAGVLFTVGSLTWLWMQNNPPEPLLNVLAVVCFLAASSLAAALLARRRQLLRDRPSIPLTIAILSFLSMPAVWMHLEVLWTMGLYVLWVGSFHLLVFLLLALLLAPIALRSSTRYFFLVERIGLFSALLLLSGAITNLLWMGIVYNRLYYSQDTVVDFYPFIPFGQWVLDVRFGDETGALMGGVALWHVQAVWLLFALIAWGGAVFGYRWTARWLAAMDPQVSLVAPRVQ